MHPIPTKEIEERFARSTFVDRRLEADLRQYF